MPYYTWIHVLIDWQARLTATYALTLPGLGTALLETALLA